MNNDGNFDFNLENIDMFKFQDKDFREEKKRVQAILLEQQAEQAKNAHHGGRIKRNAALNALETSASVHGLRQQGRNRSKEADEWDPDVERVAKPKKDTSITVMKKHFEF